METVTLIYLCLTLDYSKVCQVEVEVLENNCGHLDAKILNSGDIVDKKGRQVQETKPGISNGLSITCGRDRRWHSQESSNTQQQRMANAWAWHDCSCQPASTCCWGKTALRSSCFRFCLDEVLTRVLRGGFAGGDSSLPVFTLPFNLARFFSALCSFQLDPKSQSASVPGVTVLNLSL